ncbi:DUF4136 domain-containing protein [Oceanihabitans sp. 2_MG-2023]|uniref:DUF4136 domain-containing protein n=1 Tax=Oceanihabitans sp. 2_MG-2023 TaxID=3062661 RepID=UPI0026E2DDF1|nr:DUF4136 domain-containing protein [Oceanihabitans sp. 2_MG-2023]MDO6596082.1 DUF4136 domain-containing protein [Oceanihabitans sp. 2_MG-2023]
MKHLLSITSLLLLLVISTSCNSVRVASDYDRQVNFNNFKTFAFFKTGIDKAEINDLDKRRILRAIESELLAKGFTKSENPDLLVSIFTKSREKINVYNNNNFGPYGYGWGWSPWYWNNYNTVSKSTEGILYIDLIEASKKELVWQGQGTGYLSQNKKEERIQEFVTKIMEKYPPGLHE